MLTLLGEKGLDFNPRSPCGERRLSAGKRNGDSHISIHAPRVGSDPYSPPIRAVMVISIHAPRVGSDFRSNVAYRAGIEFQSTLPVWGATFRPPKYFERLYISIHAPRVGSDVHCGIHRRLTSNFNPRSPCGERPIERHRPSRAVLFQSTLPVWGATRGSPFCQSVVYISIHAPRVGSDDGTVIRLPVNPEFQSTLPVWGATRVFRLS